MKRRRKKRYEEKMRGSRESGRGRKGIKVRIIRRGGCRRRAKRNRGSKVRRRIK